MNHKSDEVDHPPHYNCGKIEVIEFLEDQQLGYHLGNAVKYICRAGRKDPSKTVQDLEKAIWYLRRYIELMKENPRRPNEMEDRDVLKIELRQFLSKERNEQSHLMPKCSVCGSTNSEPCGFTSNEVCSTYVCKDHVHIHDHSKSIESSERDLK